MKISRELAKVWHISTQSMERFELFSKSHIRTGLNDEFNSTKFWQDKGQLHWRADRKELTCLAYFIQRADADIRLVFGTDDRSYAHYALREHLDPDVNAVVIECKIPEEMVNVGRKISFNRAILDFIALRHPSWQIRKVAAKHVLEYMDEQENSNVY